MMYLCGTIRSVVIKKIRNETEMKFCTKTMDVPTLTYSSKIWTPEKTETNDRNSRSEIPL
jgi:hypothetical protein